MSRSNIHFLGPNNNYTVCIERERQTVSWVLQFGIAITQSNAFYKLYSNKFYFLFTTSSGKSGFRCKFCPSFLGKRCTDGCAVLRSARRRFFLRRARIRRRACPACPEHRRGEYIEGFIRLLHCHTRAGGYLFSFSGFLPSQE